MKRKITLFVFLAALAAVPFTFTTGCAVAQQQESTGQYVDDKTISTKVKTALYEDPVVKGTQVNVNTFQGVVQLSGFVENETQKERAGQIAQQAKGVRAVHNDIVVQTGR
jgi:hyperosmotically inducible protein